MKKLIILSILLIIATPTLAAVNCDSEDGIVIEGMNSNKYCLSKVAMNWWSAFTWCQAQNGTLVSLTDCELNGQTYLSTGNCPNFIGVTDIDGNVHNEIVWTSVALGTDQAYRLRMSSGAFFKDHHTREKPYHYALCK